MNKARTKLSKLDRFLILEEVYEALPDVRVTAIDRLWSDHNPILLHVSKSDFGPTPFKLFHSWLLRDSFDEVIKTELPKLEEHNFGRKLLSHKKFASSNLELSNDILKLKLLIMLLNMITCNLSSLYKRKLKRVLRMNILIFFKRRVSNGISKETRTPNFSQAAKAKRRAQMIHGIMKEGVWIPDPSQIKEEFLNFFKEKFKAHDSNVDFPPFANSSGLCALDCDSSARLGD
ncbi:hypothetical protein Tco_1298000 [Tanacetum coccineum]